MSQRQKCGVAMSSGVAAARFAPWFALAAAVWATPGAAAADSGRNAVIAAAASMSGSRLAQVRWTSYLRAGPGLEFAVLDELAGLTWLRVEGCGADWCRVATDSNRAGYLARAHLALASNLDGELPGQNPAADPSRPAGTVAGAGTTPDAKWRCVRAGLTGYHGRSDGVTLCSR